MAKSVLSQWLYLLAVLLQLASWARSSSLYDINDPLWELDPTNFERIVFNKSTAWIMEFYSSWCGHCIRFAPHWQEFAKDIENWKNVIEVGVVNCADAENTILCRNYDVTSYPTIKLFPSHVTIEDKGQKYEGNRDLSLIRHAVVNLLQSNFNKTIPSQWPNFKEITVPRLSDIWSELPDSAASAYLLIENPGSYIGREIILDFSISKKIIARRILNSNTQLLRELVPDYRNASLVLVSIDRNAPLEVLYTSPESANSTEIRDKAFELVFGRNRVREPTVVTTLNPDSDEVTKYNNVFMVDIENAVRYALYQEVATHDLIMGEELHALKAFIFALKKHFPGTPNVRAFLAKLHDWMHNHKGNITGARFSQKLDKLTTSKEYLPPMRPYVGCKGSTTKYRGYPCSLWTLFHTLTVQAYENYQDNAMIIKEAPQRILYDIRGYVKHFFSCEHCSEHFQTMSANLDVEVPYQRDTVLWLWQAHNKVNKRLAGDPTEDPKHKKVQFPTEEDCSKCRLGESTAEGEIPWDKGSVLRYVRYFYNKNRIVILNDISDNKLPEIEHSDVEDNSLVIPFNNSSNKRQWNFRVFTNVDISLCLSLYLVSALLLVVIYLFFCQARRRRKVRYKTFISAYP